MSRYWKSIIAAVTAIAITTVQAIQAAQADGSWSTDDTTVTVLAFLGAVLVYAKGNDRPVDEPYDPDISEREPDDGLPASVAERRRHINP
jgi:hypothetical protein